MGQLEKVTHFRLKKRGKQFSTFTNNFMGICRGLSESFYGRDASCRAVRTVKVVALRYTRIPATSIAGSDGAEFPHYRKSNDLFALSDELQYSNLY